MKKNLGILIVSIILVLSCGEYVLRQHLSPVAIFGPWFVPSQSVKGFEWQFLDSSSPDQDLLKNFHPVYGWNSGPAGIRKTTLPPASTSTAPKILFVGDSFIYGSEVQANQTIASRIHEFIPVSNTVNMGVPAFGIGQSYLKMIEEGMSHHPDIIVFGVHPPNYERTALDFFYRPKPKFKLTQNGELAFVPPPNYSTSQALYASVLNRRRSDFFVVAAMVKFLYLVRSKFTDTDIQKYFDTFDPVVIGILRAAKKKAEEAGAQLLVVQIPHGNRFRSDTAYQGYATEYPLNTQLIEHYGNLDISLVNLEAEFMARLGTREIFDTLYTQPNSSGSAGHLTVKGNLLAAEIIAEKIHHLSPAR